MDKIIVEKIEKFGCIGPNGYRIYGTAALLHFLRLMDRPAKDVLLCKIEAGRAFVEKYLCSNM